MNFIGCISPLLFGLNHKACLVAVWLSVGSPVNLSSDTVDLFLTKPFLLEHFAGLSVVPVSKLH